MYICLILYEILWRPEISTKLKTKILTQFHLYTVDIWVGKLSNRLMGCKKLLCAQLYEVREDDRSEGNER